jgi:ATP-binding cassette subfamily B protein
MLDKSDKLRLLWAFMQGQRLRYFAAIAAMLLATLTMYVAPLVAAATIDFVIQAKPLRAPGWLQDAVALMGGRDMLVRNLWIAALTMAALTAVSGLFNYLKGRWSAQASEAIARRLRDRLYQHLQELPCAYHDRTDTGDLVQRCTSDVDTVRSFLAVQVVEIARAILMVLTVLPFMLALSVRLTLLAMALFPVIILFSLVFLARVTTAFKVSDEAEGKMTSVIQENLTGIRVVRAFARQDFECAKFATANATFRDTTVRLINLMAWYWSCSDYTCHLQNALVLMLGGFWVMQGQADVGTLFAFVAYEGMLLWPIRQLGRLLTELGKTMVSMGRLREILQNPTEQGQPALEARPAAAAPADEKPPAATPAPEPLAAATLAGAPRLAGAISFRDLSFSYDGQRPVLQGVSFDVAAGQTVAILGPSGSGKSTLMHLLMRLYPYQHGSITLDGVELRELERHFVRGQMGVVLQEPFLYSKSLRDNIRLGAARGDEPVAEAAAAAAIHESIMSFEKGYDTLVGERGVTLSGGQRQRVALARAILKKPPILILDDALSAVDTRTESTILSALRNRRGKLTTLVIAHRLSTLAQADHIIVLDHGRVVQSGAHQDLLAQAGLYRRLWHIQNSLEEDLREELQSQADGRPGHD